MRVFLETERLILRQLTAADADNRLALDSNSEVMRFLTGGAPTPRDAIERDILPRFLGYSDRHAGLGVWAAIEKASREFLGWFSFRPRDPASPGEFELGYRLRKTAWGKGYVTEGARALIHKGFTELGARRVVATTYQDTLASRRVMEKAGLTLARTYRLTPADLLAQTTYHGASLTVWDGDDVEHALEKAEWERRAAADASRPARADRSGPG